MSPRAAQSLLLVPLALVLGAALYVGLLGLPMLASHVNAPPEMDSDFDGIPPEALPPGGDAVELQPSSHDRWPTPTAVRRGSLGADVQSYVDAIKAVQRGWLETLGDTPSPVERGAGVAMITPLHRFDTETGAPGAMGCSFDGDEDGPIHCRVVVVHLTDAGATFDGPRVGPGYFAMLNRQLAFGVAKVLSGRPFTTDTATYAAVYEYQRKNSAAFALLAQAPSMSPRDHLAALGVELGAEPLEAP